MDHAAIDAAVLWAAAYYLGGFTVGIIVRLMLGPYL
jgi:hypothetical protein